MDRELFSSLFKVGEIIDSGGPSERVNAARLEIMAIEENFVRYKSINSCDRKKIEYSYIDVVLNGFARIDPKSIQRSIQPVLLEAGLKENLWTENYAYGFAKAILQRFEICSSRAKI